MKSSIVFMMLYVSFFKGYSQYENLVFEGGGIRGLAYSGVLKELENQDIIKDIKRVGGTSAGAITALMVSIGYNADETAAIISETKFQKFNDGKYIFVGGISRLAKKYGWFRGNEFNNWLEEIIEAKTGNANITFQELKDHKFKDLYVTGTCLNKQKLVVFSHENYPSMKIKDAVRISMSIPLYFEAVLIDSLGNVYDKPTKNIPLDIVVDGGIIGNFPIFMFDEIAVDSLNFKSRIPNFKTLGVRLDTDSQIEHDHHNKDLASLEISNFTDFVSAFYVLVIESINRYQLIEQDWERTISVSSVGIGERIKKLSLEQKQSLIESGEICTRVYFEQKKTQ